MTSDFNSVFTALRAIPEKYAGDFQLTVDIDHSYCLEAVPGPATLRAWGGKLKRATIPVVWVNIGKGYVSYHLMGLYGNAALQAKISKALQARRQGKTCFNFKVKDELLFSELANLTGKSIAAFCKAGFAASPAKP